MGFFSGMGTKNFKKRIKNLFIFVFVTFLRVGQTLRGFKPPTPPPGYGLASSCFIFRRTRNLVLVCVL